MAEPVFSVKAVGERLADVWGKTSDRDVAKLLKERVKWRGSREKVRRARAGVGETIAHDLVAATALVYGVDPGWLLTGTARSLPEPAAGQQAVVEPIGDEERVLLMGMLGDVTRAIRDGMEKKKPGPPQKASPGISDEEMESDMDLHLSEEAPNVVPPVETEPTGTDD